MTQQLSVIVARTPWRIAVRRTLPAVYRNATPLLCLPGATWQHAGREIWSFDWLGSGQSDRCLAGHEPDRLRQVATVVALIQASGGAARVTIVAQDLELARRFAAAYPFAVESVMQGDDNEPVQSDRRDLRGAAA